MATGNDGWDRIEKCWENFINGRLGDIEGLRPEIADAWQRCADAGVDPRAGLSSWTLDETSLQAMLNRNRELIDIARPIMGKLHQFVAGSGFVVLLADSHGYLMAASGDRNILAQSKDINFQPGACWREDEIGNNGVGTALTLQRPVQVSGAEHYCEKHHAWTCSGTPIFDEQHQLLGILEMSGPVERTHLHTLGMVVAAVQAISDQFRIQQKNREMVLLNQRLSNIYHTVSDGIIIVDAEGLITQVNPAVEKIFSQNARDITGHALLEFIEPDAAIMQMLTSGQNFSDEELMVSPGIHCLASGKAINDEEGQLSGGVVFLKPINKIKNLVNRFSGAQARFHFRDIIGESDEIARAVRIASLAASSESNILLEGESGTGKEVFAQAIHNASSRRNNPFIAVNCGAIPRELLGSELFGYVEGAFTGAKRGGRPGKFELASGGTIFLDEIGEMPLGKQVSLLRVLQDRTVTRIGGDKVIPVDVRIICASNRNLQEEVRKGNFRRDLFYRLNVIAITLPPLRQRRQDILPLFNYFLDYISRKLGVVRPQVDPEVLRLLPEYDWPGNVRELQNVVERMVNIADNHNIGLEHLPEELLSPSEVASEPLYPGFSSLDTVTAERKKRKDLFEEIERQKIMSLLVHHGGNISQVAKSMGLSRNTIYRKLRQYGIRS